MAKEEHYHTQFEEGKFYHIYNRSIDKKLLFVNEENHLFFLKKLRRYLLGISDVYAYCLLDNHFHLLIKINENLSNYKFVNKIETETNIHEIVSKQFRIFFQSYALAFNKQHSRVGTLFQTPFKRSLINNENYLSHLVYYIHSNPLKHNLTNDFKNWKWSSYKGIISNKPSHLKRKELLEWFGSEEEYINFHNHDKFLLNDKYIIDDF